MVLHALRGLMRTAALLTGIVAVSVAMGLIVSLFALPALVPVAGGTRELSRYYLSLPDRVEEPPLPQRSRMLDANGNVFARFDAYDRVPVPGDAMAPVIRDTVVAVEDARFYEHAGYDPVGLVRAMVSNAGDGATQGGSTITQQSLKNVLALQAELGSTDERATGARDIDFERKLIEIRMAARLTEEVSKDEVLTRYLNIAYFGSGAYGIQAAARRYFSVPARKLNANQAAILTSLLKNPTGYDPLKYPKVARERRDIVLSVMAREGVITSQQATKISRRKLGLNPSRPRTGCAVSKYPFYCEEVMSTLRNDPAFGATAEERTQLLAIGGLRIKTALVPKAMAATRAAAQSTVPPNHRVATAVALVRPGTGRVVGMASSRNYGAGAPDRTQIVLPTRAAFQPGSTFKMFTLAAALDAGLPISTRLPGGAAYTSRIFNNPSKGYYSNSAGSASNVTLAKATQMSMNTAFVQLEEKVGIEAVASMANKLGVTTTGTTGPGAPGPKDGSYTLGTASVSVVDMANAYATIAGGGIACPATFVLEVHDATGEKLASPDRTCRRVIDEAAANSVAHILGTVVSQGTGKPAAFGRPAAGKTGTTENLGAAWFAGFTPQYASAVWVGDPKGSSNPLYNVLGYSRVYGGTLPATVWRKTMADIHTGLPVKPLPRPDPSYVATSSGVMLPDVVGQRAAQARLRLLAAGVSKVVVTRTGRGPGQRSGMVVAQSESGTAASTVRKVTLTVTR